MAEVSARFGDRVQLHGINLSPEFGTERELARAYASAGLSSPTAQLHYADLNHGIPFPSRHFDVVVSQVCLVFVAQKALVLEECARVLATGGVALLDADFDRSHVPEPYRLCMEVRASGQVRTFKELVTQTPWIEQATDMPDRSIVVHACAEASLGLRLVDAVVLERVDPTWYGTRSVYSPVHAGDDAA
jgi:SAM-dependent methyltransferase